MTENIVTKDKWAYQEKIYNPEINKNKNYKPYPYVETLKHWIDNEVTYAKENYSMRYMSEVYFHRKELRAQFIDNNYFFTPADGVITNVNEKVDAKASLVEVKGVNFSLADLLQDDTLEGDFLVITVFMTFYSDHNNYIPYSGNSTWYDLPSLQTYNLPMLAMEKSLLKGVVNPVFEEPYLKKNARRVHDIYNSNLDISYKVIQIADFDVDTLVDFKQTDPDHPMFFKQNTNFGKIQYGSSCVLAIPLLENHVKFKLRKEAEVGNYVKCCRTPLVSVCWNEVYAPNEVQHVEEEY